MPSSAAVADSSILDDNMEVRSFNTLNLNSQAGFEDSFSSSAANPTPQLQNHATDRATVDCGVGSYSDSPSVFSLQTRPSLVSDHPSSSPHSSNETYSLGAGFDLIRAAVASMNANPASFPSRSSDGSAVATTPPEQENQPQNHMEMSGVLPTVDYSEDIEDVTGPSSTSSVASSPSDDGEGFHHGIMDSFAALDTAPFPSWQGYSSVSEMNEVQESREGTFLPGYTTTDHMQLQAIVHQLFQSSGIGHNVSTIPEDSEDGNDGDLFQDYDPIMEPLKIALSEHDDDPDDTKKFYLGDEEEIGYYNKSTYQQITPLTEIDFDDFYQESDSQPMLPTTDVANPGLPAGQEEHDYVDEDSNDEGFGADHFHGTSMPSFLFI